VGNVLPLQITEPVSSRKCGKIISHEYEWAFRYQFFAAGTLWILISHKFWLRPLEYFFLQFKKQVSFKYKNKISAVQCKRKTF
jgi:hypothetical protein